MGSYRTKGPLYFTLVSKGRTMPLILLGGDELNQMATRCNITKLTGIGMRDAR